LEADEENLKLARISFSGNLDKRPSVDYEMNTNGFYSINETTNWINQAKLQIDEQAENTIRETMFELKEIE
jgi:hypothetical protein